MDIYNKKTYYSPLYVVESVYLEEKRIKAYFEPKGWKKYVYKKGSPTLVYLDGKNVYQKKQYFNLKCYIKNLSGLEKKYYMTDKKNLSLILLPKYFMKSYNYNTSEDLTVFKNIFKRGKRWILKPALGAEGIGITIVQNYKELKNFFENDIEKINFGRIRETNQWVVQEYLNQPMLYKNRKFHLRIYFLIVGKKIYYFKKYLIATAFKEYIDDDYCNKDIHDSHYNEKSIRNKIYPDDFDKKIDIEEDVFNIFKDLKNNIILPLDCYPESKKCYEIFAADVMITKDGKVKVLEFNNSIGEPATMDRKYPLFENQLDLVLKYYNLVDDIDLENNYFVEV